MAAIESQIEIKMNKDDLRAMEELVAIEKELIDLLREAIREMKSQKSQEKQ